MCELGVAETNVEPARVEHGSARNCAVQTGKVLVEILQGSQVERRDVNREVVKFGERRREDVELALAARHGNCARYVRVREPELGILDMKPGEVSTRRTHRSSDIALPVVRKRLAVQCSEQIEIDRGCRELDVTHDQRILASREGHSPTQAGARRAYIHVAERKIGEVELLRLRTNVQVRAARAGSWERRVNPCDVVQRHRICMNVNVVSDREVASPYDLPLCPSRRSRKVDAWKVEPYGITELPDYAGRVGEQKRRISLGHLQSGKAEQHSGGIRIADARCGEVGISGGPTPGSSVSLGGATNLVVLACQLEMNGAIECSVFQPRSRVPRKREHERRIAKLHRVHDYERTGLLGLKLGRFRFAKNLPEIPVAVLMLAYVHNRMLDAEVVEQHASVQQIAQVVTHRHASRRKEERILCVANGDGVDGDSREEPVADAPHVQRSVDPL